MSFSRTLIMAGFITGAFGQLQAQTSIKSSDVLNANGAAARLRNEAVALYNQPDRFDDAARIHLREAMGRSARDREGVNALIMAGHLFHYARRPLAALGAMEQAGERAISLGDVSTAATAFVDAAFLAQKCGDLYTMHKLARKALLLLESPLLTFEMRNSIRRRIAETPTLATLVQ